MRYIIDKTPLELSDIGWIDVYDSAEEETS